MPPVALIVSSNDRRTEKRYLRSVARERREIRERLKRAENEHVLEVRPEADPSPDELFDVFQDPHVFKRLAIFHYAGHANEASVFLESRSNPQEPVPTRGDALAVVLGKMPALSLVFLNGCATREQGLAFRRAGVPIVIVTSAVVDDQLATEFAVRFYSALGDNNSIRDAFALAEQQLRATSNYEATMSRELDLDDGASHWGEPDGEFDSPWVLLADDEADEWRLGEAADDPLFGLPAPHISELPPTPFPGPRAYTSEHAALYFGRERETRSLYDALSGSRPRSVILLGGVAGSGKTSLLEAGLLPRLHENFTARSERLERGTFAAAFARALRVQQDDLESLREAWSAQERQHGKPPVVILDQVESALAGREHVYDASALEELTRIVGALTTSSPEEKRAGSIILAVRSHHAGRLRSALEGRGVTVHELTLRPLTRAAIVRIIYGPVSSTRLRAVYDLEIEDEFATRLATELTEDTGATIAPVLQEVLSRMWFVARPMANQSGITVRRFTEALYRDTNIYGSALEKHLRASLRSVPGGVGLPLDLLSFHVSKQSLHVVARTEAQLQQRYSHAASRLPSLLHALEDARLLVRDTRGGPCVTRITHPFLARSIEQLGQKLSRGDRAERELEAAIASRKARGGRGGFLSWRALRVVAGARAEMRAWTREEEALVEQSKRRNRLFAGALVTVALTIGGAVAMTSMVRGARNGSPTSARERARTGAPETRRAEKIESRSATAVPVDSLAGAVEVEPSTARTRLERALTRACESSGLAEPELAQGLADAIHGFRERGRWACSDDTSLRFSATDHNEPPMYVAVCDDDRIKIWDSTDLAAGIEDNLRDSSNYIAFARSRDRLLAFDRRNKTLDSWRLSGANLSGREVEVSFADELGGVEAAEIRPEKRLAVVDKNGALMLWNGGVHKLGTLGKQAKFGFNATGKCLYGVLPGGEVAVWHTEGKAPLKTKEAVSQAAPIQLEFNAYATKLFVRTEDEQFYMLKGHHCAFGSAKWLQIETKQAAVAPFTDAYGLIRTTGAVHLVDRNRSPYDPPYSAMTLEVASDGVTFAFVDTEGTLRGAAVGTDSYELGDGFNLSSTIQISRGSELMLSTRDPGVIELWSLTYSQSLRPLSWPSNTAVTRFAVYDRSGGTVAYSRETYVRIASGEHITDFDLEFAPTALFVGSRTALAEGASGASQCFLRDGDRWLIKACHGDPADSGLATTRTTRAYAQLLTALKRERPGVDIDRVPTNATDTVAAVGDNDGYIEVLRANEAGVSTYLRFHAMPGAAEALAISPDGGRVLVADRHGRVGEYAISLPLLKRQASALLRGRSLDRADPCAHDSRR